MGIIIKHVLVVREKVIGKIAELSDLDKKEVEKAMKQLKEEGAIVSPVRCKWAPAE